MRITVELSLYPLAPGFAAHITDFIAELRREPGLEVVTNRMSTQVRGEFDVVLPAISRCTRAAMERVHPVVLVAKFLNADLDISTAPTMVGAASAATPVGAASAATGRDRAMVGAASAATGRGRAMVGAASAATGRGRA